MAKIEVNTERILAELKEYAGETPFKLQFKPGLQNRVSIRETDKQVDITINTERIKTQEQLDMVMEDCQHSLRLR